MLFIDEYDVPIQEGYLRGYYDEMILLIRNLYAFVLGMLISLSESYEVKSNKESGYGRYDVIIIPKDISKIGIIIEFKKIDDFLNHTVEEATTAEM